MDNMERFKLDIVEELGRIEDKCKSWSVPMSKVTLIMRAPNDANMFVVLTTETPDGMKVAAALALGEGAVIQGEGERKKEDSRE